MTMAVEQYLAPISGRLPLIPPELAGQWLAWNDDRTEIVAHGAVYSDVFQEALARGCEFPVIQKVA
jgi:hypothetical protein